MPNGGLHGGGSEYALASFSPEDHRLSIYTYKGLWYFPSIGCSPVDKDLLAGRKACKIVRILESLGAGMVG